MPPVAIIVAAPVVAMVAWGVVRLRRGRAAIRASLERAGYRVVSMQHRIIRQGPLFWTTTRSQVVYRVVVSDADGRQRTGWARWGRRWLPNPDTLDLCWDE